MPTTRSCTSLWTSITYHYLYRAISYRAVHETDVNAFTQGQGVMPDGTSRLSTMDGKVINHFMGCSTFAEYAVIAEISAAKIHPGADLNKVKSKGFVSQLNDFLYLSRTDVLTRLWRLHWLGRRVQHAQDGTRQDRGCFRPRRPWSVCHSGI